MYDRPEIFHPMLVHFPIALIIGSFAAMAAYAATRNEFFSRVGAWTVTLGAVAAVAAGIAGKVAEANATHTEEAHEILKNFHEPLAYAVIGLTVLLSFWGFACKWKFKGVNLAAYILVLGLAVGAAGLTGHFGARMVYEEGMGINPKVLKPAIHEHHHMEPDEQEKANPDDADTVEHRDDSGGKHDGHSPIHEDGHNHNHEDGHNH